VAMGVKYDSDVVRKSNANSYCIYVHCYLNAIINMNMNMLLTCHTYLKQTNLYSLFAYFLL